MAVKPLASFRAPRWPEPLPGRAAGRASLQFFFEVTMTNSTDSGRLRARPAARRSFDAPPAPQPSARSLAALDAAVFRAVSELAAPVRQRPFAAVPRETFAASSLPAVQPVLLDEHEAANVLNVSVRTLQAWRFKRCGPPYAKLGRSVRYRRTDLAAWLDASTHAAEGGR